MTTRPPISHRLAIIGSSSFFGIMAAVLSGRYFELQGVDFLWYAFFILIAWTVIENDAVCDWIEVEYERNLEEV